MMHLWLQKNVDPSIYSAKMCYVYLSNILSKCSIQIEIRFEQGSLP